MFELILKGNKDSLLLISKIENIFKQPGEQQDTEAKRHIVTPKNFISC